MRIYPRKGKIRTIWYIDYVDSAGNRIRKAVGPKKAAEDMLAEIRTAKIRGEMEKIPGADRGAKISAFVEKYMNHIEQTHVPETVKKDKSRIKAFLRFAEEKQIKYLRQMTPGLIVELQSEYLKTHQQKAWNNLLGLLKTMLNRAVDWGDLDYNPLARVKSKSPPSKFNFYSKEELHTIVAAAADPLRTGIILLVNTGMRRGELFHQKVRDIDIENGNIRIVSHEKFTTKNKKSRNVPIASEIRPLIKKLIAGKKPDDYLFRPYVSEHKLYKEFKKLLKDLGLKGNVHDLRHTFASHLAMGGTPLPIIGELLGHADIRTTMIYAHLLPSRHRKELEKLPFKGLVNLKV